VPGHPPVSPEELHFKLLRLLQANPALSQRQLARDLGISLGRVNYCLQALIAKGWLKTRNFKDSRNKRAYAYLLTPKGIEEKAHSTLRFLRAKLGEHDQLTREIEQLRQEVAALPDPAVWED
jgi:MarR family transcriptional regulator, temperature-dependent positive regulator of motility